MDYKDRNWHCERLPRSKLAIRRTSFPIALLLVLVPVLALLSAFKAKADADTVAPTTPTNLAATPVSTTQINLNWTASTDNVGVVGYVVKRCAHDQNPTSARCIGSLAQIGFATGTVFSDTTANNSALYLYVVFAKDAAGNLSRNSNIVYTAALSGPDSEPPTAPSGLTLVAVSSSQVTLTWTAATDNIRVQEYGLERCAGTNCTNFAQVGPSSVTSFIDTGLISGAAYRYQVRAIDAAGNVGPPSNIASVTTQASVPQSETISYSYDAKGRLTHVLRNGASNSNVATDYSYDKANNRKTQVTTGSSH